MRGHRQHENPTNNTTLSKLRRFDTSWHIWPTWIWLKVLTHMNLIEDIEDHVPKQSNIVAHHCLTQVDHRVKFTSLIHYIPAYMGLLASELSPWPTKIWVVAKPKISDFLGQDSIPSSFVLFQMDSIPCIPLKLYPIISQWSQHSINMITIIVHCVGIQTYIITHHNIVK